MACGDILDISDIQDLILVASMIAAEISTDSYIKEGEAETALKSLEGTLDNFHETFLDVADVGVPSYENIYGISGDF
ncbi:MAG: hypothetical protein WBA93_04175 [Microcoleaceae cyanobacterium]